MKELERAMPDKVQEVVTIRGYTGRRVVIRERASFGLSFCRSGKITYTHGDKRFVSVPGTAVILPQGASYRLYDNEGGDFPLINFTCARPFTEEFLVIPLVSNSEYLTDFEKLRRASVSGRSQLSLLGFLYTILGRLAEEGTLSPAVSPALAYITAHLTDPLLKNKAIAEACGVSECYLRRQLTAYCGQSPHRYILERRLNLARQMLAESETAVSVIAEECGFSTVYHFCRAFKSAAGMTPTEYRRTFRGRGR